jgi:hypothetical protein
MASAGSGDGENVMILSTDGKILIDGYIDEVCVNLPKKKRTDIAVEIRSLILDALEARSQEFKKDPDEEMILSVLKEIGSPIEIASAYHPHNYVIGPQLYAPFWMTVRGILLFMGIFYILGFFISWGEAAQSLATFGSVIWDLVISFIENVLQNLAVVFLIFIILDRIIPDQDWVIQLKIWGSLSNTPFLREFFGRTAAGEWDPKVLATTPKSERVKQGETIFELVILFLVLVLFNFFPDKVGAYGIISDSGPWFVPLLAPTFQIYLPWWNVYWLLSLGLNFILLISGRWNHFMRWVELGLMIFSGFLVYWMLTGPPVIGLTPEYLLLNGTSAEAVRVAEETLIPILTEMLGIVFILHLIVKVWHISTKLLHLLGKPPILVLKSGNNETKK